MSERVTAWQCIGCGRIEAPQQCIGVCRDRKIELIGAADHDTEVEALHERIETLASIVRQLAVTTPREGQCGRTWTVIQARAREALQKLGDPRLAGAA